MDLLSLGFQIVGVQTGGSRGAGFRGDDSLFSSVRTVRPCIRTKASWEAGNPLDLLFYFFLSNSSSGLGGRNKKSKTMHKPGGPWEG